MSFVIAEKAVEFFSSFKPKCVLSMEKSLKELKCVTDKTNELVKKNGHALERARPYQREKESH